MKLPTVRRTDIFTILSSVVVCPTMAVMTSLWTCSLCERFQSLLWSNLSPQYRHWALSVVFHQHVLDHNVCGSTAETTNWLDVHERLECVCTGRPIAPAPVGAHQSEVSTVGTASGRRRKWRWGALGQGHDNEDILRTEQVGWVELICFSENRGRAKVWRWRGLFWGSISFSVILPFPKSCVEASHWISCWICFKMSKTKLLFPLILLKEKTNTTFIKQEKIRHTSINL